jgi:hypothetical protein
MWTARIRKRFQPVICAAADDGDELPAAVFERVQCLAHQAADSSSGMESRGAFDGADVLIGALPEFKVHASLRR